MKLIPNIGPARRLLYVLAGLGMLALALLAPFLKRPWPVVLGVFGAAAFVEGAIGF